MALVVWRALSSLLRSVTRRRAAIPLAGVAAGRQRFWAAIMIISGVNARRSFCISGVKQLFSSRGRA